MQVCTLNTNSLSSNCVIRMLIYLLAVYQGLATSLDTLCAQAFGSGKKKLVGLQMQRMVCFLWVITLPIALLWFFADRILNHIVPEKDVADLAGLYLKVVALGAPGYAAFESGKRYVQAQGIFSASLYVLLICAPLNAFMNWLFVWVSSDEETCSSRNSANRDCSNSNGASLVHLSLWPLLTPSCLCYCASMCISSTAPNAGMG